MSTDYRHLALNLIDLAVEFKLYWLVISGFANAEHCINDLDDDRGYWELVYVSIASNIDSYDVKIDGYNT